MDFFFFKGVSVGHHNNKHRGKGQAFVIIAQELTSLTSFHKTGTDYKKFNKRVDLLQNTGVGDEWIDRQCVAQRGVS